METPNADGEPQRGLLSLTIVSNNLDFSRDTLRWACHGVCVVLGRHLTGLVGVRFPLRFFCTDSGTRMHYLDYPPAAIGKFGRANNRVKPTRMNDCDPTNPTS